MQCMQHVLCITVYYHNANIKSFAVISVNTYVYGTFCVEAYVVCK